jgi:hypothetical protein
VCLGENRVQSSELAQRLNSVKAATGSFTTCLAGIGAIFVWHNPQLQRCLLVRDCLTLKHAGHTLKQQSLC